METGFLMPGVKRIVLDNGLRVLFARGPEPSSNLVMVHFGVGSAYEANEQAGLFHLLEHVLFKSSDPKRSRKMLMDLEARGTQVNASTDFHSTELFAEMLPQLTVKVLKLFFEMVANPRYNATEVAREKRVVLDEIRNDLNEPCMVSNELFYSTLFAGNYPARSVTGYPSTLRNITGDVLEETKTRFYAASNMAVVVIGRCDQEILKTIYDTFGTLEPGALPPPLPAVGNVVRQIVKKIHTNALRSQAFLNLGYQVPGSLHKDYPKLLILDSLLSGGFSSRLFLALREKRGIGYTVTTSLADFGDFGAFYASVPGLHQNGVDRTIEVILKEFRNLREKKVSKAELETAKYRFLYSHKKGLKEAEAWAYQILMREFFHLPIDFRRLAQYVWRLTPADIQQAAHDYLTDDYTLTVLLPK